jgi:hypothetical protein
VEFPRSTNNFSFSHATRLWDLLQDKGPHSQLAAFDQVNSFSYENSIITSQFSTI